jgi:HK97 family phage major capsid protein
MSDIDDIKGLFTETQKTLEAVRSDVEGLKGKSADYIDADRQNKMKAELAGQLEAEQKAREALEARLEAVETASNRPGAGGKGADDELHAKAFNDYLRKGVEADELKSMSTQVNADGGYLVASQMEAGIRERLRRSSPVRAVANVVSLDGNSYDILIERGDAGAEWAGERATRSETDTPTVNRISIALHELSALPKVTQRLLDNSTYDVEGWLTGYVADKFSRTEATAFVSGDGVDKPKGFLSYSKSTAADDSRAAHTLQYRITGAAGAFAASNPADVIVRTFYDLQGGYQANASWMMKNTTAAEVAVLKDGDGAYLIRGMFNADGVYVRTIQGRPMYMADDMPAIADNAYSIAVGDFNAGYTIVDGKSVTVLRDPYSAKPNVLFYTTKRVGGGLVEADAIKLIQFAD